MDKIFGYDFADIQRAQQGGKLQRTVKGPPAPAVLLDTDHALIAQYKTPEALEAAGLFGVADRLRRVAEEK